MPSDDRRSLPDPSSRAAEETQLARSLLTSGGPAAMLVEAGILTTEQVTGVIGEARRRGVSLWEVVLEKNLPEDGLADTLARWLGLPRWQGADEDVRADALACLDEELARKHAALPLRAEDRTLVVAMSNPADHIAVREIEFASGLSVRAEVATRADIYAGIDRHYVVEDRFEALLDAAPDVPDLSVVAGSDVDLDELDGREAAQLAPVIKMCNLIIQDAQRADASDVHVEPTARTVRVRFRVHGVLRDYMQIPGWLHRALVSRVKILADLDIAERRLPQDGRIRAQFQGRPLDIRVSTLPTQFGEKAVLRLLRSSQIPSLEEIGLGEADEALVRKALAQPQGLILMTGPTGSGKTTSLYSMLTQRRSEDVNIVTVEDPIEYQLPGVNQVQVNTKTGLTFPSCLRSILRQDPDVVLVGEIRDLETAEIAFRAAMTGHLVLSTLHTNSSLSTLVRLLDLGVDPVLITSAVNLILAQRLARKICEECKESYTPEPAVLERLRLDPSSTTFHRGRGCKSCGGTGVAGRIGIFGSMRMTPKLKDLIHRRASESELRRAAAASGSRTLLEDAIQKIERGVVSPDEVARVVQTEDDDLSRCPECSAFVHIDFSACPYCLHALKDLCDSCGSEMRPDWRICPFCATAGNERATARPSPIRRQAEAIETSEVRKLLGLDGRPPVGGERRATLEDRRAGRDRRVGEDRRTGDDRRAAPPREVVNGRCGGCEQEVRPEWSVCPFCAEPLALPGPPGDLERRGGRDRRGGRSRRGGRDRRGGRERRGPDGVPVLHLDSPSRSRH